MDGYGSIEYWYDDVGNMVADSNKHIQVTYNYLNLPELIDFGNNDYIEYIYDASGNKLAMYIIDNNLYIDSIFYIGEFMYQADSIEYILTSEGIANSTGDGFQYEYFLKDHLGNTRVRFKDDDGSADLIQEVHYYPFGMTFPGMNYEGEGDNNYLSELSVKWLITFCSY